MPTEIKIKKELNLPFKSEDLFYSLAETQNVMPTVETCNSLDTSHQKWITTCNASNFNNNIESCIDKELCINRENYLYASEINFGNNASQENYLNTKIFYDKELLNTINLGVGILIVTVLNFKFIF
jgi:hypothetical protein